MGYPTLLQRYKWNLEILKDAIGIVPGQQEDIDKEIILLRVKIGELMNPLSGDDIDA